MCSICFLESPCKILALQVFEDALPLDLWCEEFFGGVKTGVNTGPWGNAHSRLFWGEVGQNNIALFSLYSSSSFVGSKIGNLEYLGLDHVLVAVSCASHGIDFHCTHHIAGNSMLIPWEGRRPKRQLQMQYMSADIVSSTWATKGQSSFKQIFHQRNPCIIGHLLGQKVSAYCLRQSFLLLYCICSDSCFQSSWQVWQQQHALYNRINRSSSLFSTFKIILNWLVGTKLSFPKLCLHFCSGFGDESWQTSQRPCCAYRLSAKFEAAFGARKRHISGASSGTVCIQTAPCAHPFSIRDCWWGSTLCWTGLGLHHYSHEKNPKKEAGRFLTSSALHKVPWEGELTCKEHQSGSLSFKLPAIPQR